MNIISRASILILMTLKRNVMSFLPMLLETEERNSHEIHLIYLGSGLLMTSMKLFHRPYFLFLKPAFSIHFLINACGYDSKHKTSNFSFSKYSFFLLKFILAYIRVFSVDTFFLAKNHNEFCQKESLIENINITFCHINNVSWTSLFQLLLVLVLFIT